MDEKQKSVPAECKERISFDGFYSFVHYASNPDSQTVLRQLAQSKRPHGTRNILLSAASFPT